MKKSRVLAVVMAVLMMVTLLPSMVFATAVPSGTLDGKLKVKGTLAIGSTLSADYSKVKPEGITDDNVSFSWSLKDGDLLTEVGTDKTYKIDEKDLGLPIVLKITGKEETGVSGELTVTTQEVSETEEEAKALAEKKKEEAKAAGEDPDAEESEASAASESSENTPDTEAGTSEEPDSAQPEETIEPAEETESADVQENTVQENTDAQEPADTQEPAENSVIEVNGEQSGPQNADEADTSGDSQTETPDSADTAADASEKNEEPTYSASAYTEDGSGILDFGSVEEGYTEIPEAQMVTITNNGTGDLNFKEIAPENFMAADINDAPLKSGESVTVWVKPREGLKAGEYKDLITYQTEEGADVFFEADFTVKEPENKKAEDHENNEQTDPGETSDPAAEKIYKLIADPTELPFDDLTAGYEKVETTSTVTIKNEGTEAVTLVQPESEFFDIAPVSEVESSGNIQLAQGGEQTFTVQPKLGLSAKDDPYVEELVFASDESTEASATVTASVMVKTETPKTVTATVKPEGPLKFGTLEQGYETAPDAQPVTVENTGTEAIRIQLSAPEDYEVGEPSAEVLNPGDKAATFTVQPKTGLQVGDHSDTISVTDQNTGNTLAEVRLEFTVSEPEPEPEPNPGLSVTDSLEFGTKEEGYKELPDAKKVTVTNTGNTKIVLKQPSSNAYTIGTLSATELEAGDNATFSVQPVSGLSQGEYLEDIVIANDANVEAYVNVHFSVTKKKTDNGKKANNLTGIKKPSDIKDLPNGTQKTQKALKLPGTVKITTTKGEQKASVKWDVKGSSYDPSSAERQIFNVKGTVILPEGVKNPNKISTVIAVSITVNGYQGTEAAASDNKITGIDSNGKYDTNTKITFTAAGAGMDNTNPRKGDTRYQPKSWKITETRTWDGEPYTATFRVSKPGKYTLKVTFGQQKYDGSSWKDTGTQSESTVTFTVSQAAVLTATPSPAVTQTNQKSAVQTGDSTPIMTFVIILIVAVVCIGGILVYRRKKK